MKIFIEKLIIFTLSSYTIFSLDDTSFILTLLISLGLSLGLDLVKNKYIKIFIYLSFFSLSLFFKGFEVYLPLLIYNLYMDYKNLALITFLYTLLLARPMIFILSILSIYLSHERLAYQDYVTINTSLKDKLREDTFNLKSYSETILARKDKDIELAILKERDRISRELHNSVGHLISSSILQIEAMTFKVKDSQILDSLDSLQGRLTLGIKDIRNTIHSIYEESIDLDFQLDKIIEDTKGIDISYQTRIENQINYKLALDMISIIKEAITNTLKHSTASSLEIKIFEEKTFYILNIFDNGKGYINMSDKGMGLLSIKETVKKYKGAINIKTEDGFNIYIHFMKGRLDEGNNN